MMVRIRGNMIYLMKKYIIDRFGHDEFVRMTELMNDESKEFFNGVISSGEMYDMQLYWDIVDAIYDLFGKSVLVEAHEAQAEKQVSGFFGFFIKFISPEAIMKQASKMWDKGFDEGRLDIIRFDDKGAHLKVSEFKYTDNDLIGTVAYFKRFLEVISKKDVEARAERIDGLTTEFFLDYRKN